MGDGLFRILLVNNGHPDSCNTFLESPDITVLQPGKNLGWEGGINYGLKHSEAEFVVMSNDDVHIPHFSRLWLQEMLPFFTSPEVAGVGPSSNVVMGSQNIFSAAPYAYFKTGFLIGFCAMYRRKYLDQVGHLDESLPGGDDLDLSIRLRQAGYKLVVDRNVFVYHHGFKTGERVRGDSGRAMGWNSFEMYQATKTALIKKHGLRVWWDTMNMGLYPQASPSGITTEDTEGDYIRKELPQGKVLDLGCGFRKTREDVIGIDMIPKGEVIDTLSNISVADVVADVSQALPEKEADAIIARHVLEHVIDPIQTLKHWKASLKMQGLMFIAVPNHNLGNTIPMNIQHVHGFTPESLTSLVEALDMKVLDIYDPQNGISFVAKVQV
jgi:hypothetical protein